MKIDLRPAVTQAFAELGDTPEAVADTLARRGIKGFRNNIEHNPLAQMLRHIAGSDAAVEVHPRSAFVANGYDIVIVDLPSAVRNFYLEFEYGLHPGLDVQGEVSGRG